MSPTLHAADHFIIIGYFVLLASIGVYFWRRMKASGAARHRRVIW